MASSNSDFYHFKLRVLGFWFFGSGSSGSSHFMVGVRLKAFSNKHLAVSVGNFRTTYIRKPFSAQALRRS
jgi:hypothetical protein